MSVEGSTAGKQGYNMWWANLGSGIDWWSFGYPSCSGWPQIGDRTDPALSGN